MHWAWLASPHFFKLKVEETSMLALCIIFMVKLAEVPGLICYLLNIFCFGNSFQKCVLQLLCFRPPSFRG